MAADKPERLGSNSALRDFLTSEAGGGVLLMLAAALAMIVANSPLYHAYHELLEHPWGLMVKMGGELKNINFHYFVNDGLMAIFFFLVGLEIKREFIDGRLRTWEQRRLPILAAAAGMIAPAIIYLSVTMENPMLQNGWAIPAATDIAFAIGVLALLGKRAPASLKLFLVTVAIVDDMGAVAIIALVYTQELATIWLMASAIVLGIMYAMNKGGIRSIPVYIVFSVILWYCVLSSGVHATIAGVLAALCIPIERTPGAPDSKTSPLHIMEHAIHPWSSYLIIPVFGFANAGVSLEGMGLEQVFAPLPLGIALGLFVGKQIGIFGSVWIAVKTGFAEKLGGASWMQIYGVSMLCGIGFTMSLFIGALAFPGNALLIDEAKIGVLLGSILSATAGFLVLRFTNNADKTMERQIAKEEGLEPPV